MSLLLKIAAYVLAISPMLPSVVAAAEVFPSKTIRIFTSIGGAADLSARTIGQELTSRLGQPVVVENRGGAGFVAAELVAKAAPDGYTLLVYGQPFWIGPLIEKASFDPLRDFIPVVLTVSSTNVLAVHPSLPVRSVKELIAFAKGKPGALNYSTGQAGSTTHMAMELFKAMAGVDIVRVPYKSGTLATTDLIAGNVQLSFVSVVGIMPLMAAGRLRGLAVSSAQPSALVPGMPTIAASGLPGFQSASTVGVFVPARTPMSVVNQLNQEIVRALKQPELKERIFRSGAEVVGGTPEESAAAIKSEIATLGKVIRDAGIRAE